MGKFQWWQPAGNAMFTVASNMLLQEKLMISISFNSCLSTVHDLLVPPHDHAAQAT